MSNFSSRRIAHCTKGQGAVGSIHSQNRRKKCICNPDYRPIHPPNFNLPPIPPVTCFENDPWLQHPLLLYSPSHNKQQANNEVVLKRGKKVKTEVATHIFKNKDKEDIRKSEDAELESFLTQQDFDEYRRDSVKSSPIVRIHPKWLKRMAGMIPESVKKKNFELFRTLMKEVELRYDSTVRESILNYVLRTPGKSNSSHQMEGNLPLYEEAKIDKFYSAPPHWSDTYRANRHSLSQNLRLLHPLVAKTFLKMRDAMWKHKLFRAEKLKELAGSSHLRPVELKDLIISQIHSSGDRFLNRFLPQLISIYRNPHTLKALPEGKQELIMECASNLVLCDVKKWAMGTVEEIVEAYESHEKYLPRILVDTAIEEGKVTYAPPMEGWMFCFMKIVDEISNVVQNLPDPSEIFWDRAEPDASIKVYLRIQIPPVYVEEMKKRFQIVMERWLAAAQVVADRIYDQFQPLLDGSAKSTIQEFIKTEGHTFYDAFTHSEMLRELGTQIYEIPKNEFTAWLQINNEDVIGRLLDACKNHHNLISEHLSRWLRQHNQDVISRFKEIQTRLLKKPVTTGELMDLIEYTTEARSVILTQLKEDVITGLKMCLAYMDYYVLGVEAMELMVQAHRLLPRIFPVFDKSAIMIEARKTQLEDQLFNKMDETKEYLKKLLRRVKEDFGRYGEYSDVSKYYDDLKFVMKRAQTLEDSIKWILDEESHFKMAHSKFEDMDELLSHLEPYSKLYQVVLKWKKAEKKFLDGDFVLDADAIDEETDNYLKSLNELQSLFKERIKAQKEQEAKEKHVPVTLLYDENNLTNIPPPLKLCNEGIKRLEDFRNELRTIRILSNPALQKRHWIHMSEISRMDMTPNTGTSLRKMINMNLDIWMDRFEEISNAATQELELANAIQAMKDAWLEIKFVLVPYGDREINILENGSDILQTLNSQIEETQVLKESRFCTPHKDTVTDWEATLLSARTYLHDWLRIQSRWIFLDRMFYSEDIQVLLPDDLQVWYQLDEAWRTLMEEPGDNGDEGGALDLLQRLEVEDEILLCLQLVKKLFYSLALFWQMEGQHPEKIQPFLKEAFEGIDDFSRIESEDEEEEMEEGEEGEEYLLLGEDEEGLEEEEEEEEEGGQGEAEEQGEEEDAGMGEDETTKETTSEDKEKLSQSEESRKSSNNEKRGSLRQSQDKGRKTQF